MDDPSRMGGGEHIGDRNGCSQQLVQAQALTGESASRLLPRTYSITMKSLIRPTRFRK